MSKWICSLAAMMMAASTMLAADKLATVDLEVVVRSHPKTEGNKQTLRNTQKEYEEQRDTVKAKIDKLQENFLKASEQASNETISAKMRDAAKGTAREILTELRKEEDTLRTLIARLQRSLNETEVLLFEGTMKDINAKIEEIAAAKGVSMVIDKSAIRTGAPVPVVLWSAPSLDITEEVVKAIGGTIKAEAED